MKQLLHSTTTEYKTTLEKERFQEWMLDRLEAGNLKDFNEHLHNFHLQKIARKNANHRETINENHYLLQEQCSKIARIIEEKLQLEWIDIQLSQNDFDIIQRWKLWYDIAFRSIQLLKTLWKENYISLLQQLEENFWDNTEFIKDITTQWIYLNIAFTDDFWLFWVLQAIEYRDRFGESQLRKWETMIAEYSSPNAAKHLHAWHIRSTVIWQVLGNIYSKVWYNTHRLNHVNDWWWFGELIEWYARWWKQLQQQWLKWNDLFFEIYSIFRKAEKQFNIENSWYSDVFEYFACNNQEDFISEYSKFKQLSRESFRSLESWWEEEFKIRQLISQSSLQDFDKFYQSLGVSHDFVIWESFYEKLWREVIQEWVEKWIIVLFDQKHADQQIAEYLSTHPTHTSQQKDQKIKEINSDVGSYVALLDNFERYVVLRSDWASIYSTRDLGCLKYRCENRNPSTIMYEVWQEQADHFNKLFETGRKFGWDQWENGITRSFLHISHWFYVNKATKKKLSSREWASNVLQLIESSKKYFSDKYRWTNKFSLSEIEKIGWTLWKASIIINDLKKWRMDPVYVDADLQKTLEWFEESGGAYLMYTLCRAKSLVAKSEQNVSFETIDDELSCDNTQIDHLKLLLQLPTVLQKASISHEPSIVVDYMFKVAQSYNSIYNTHKKMSQDTVWQLISMWTETVLANCFKVCNIEPLERI